MEWRYYTLKDYPTLTDWCESWGWEKLPEFAIPRIGVVVSNEGVDLCMGFIYQTDSGICWAENIISNRKASREIRKGCVDFLLNILACVAKDHGFVVMMSSIKNKSLINKMVNSGYSDKLEENMTNLMRVL